MYVFLTLMDRCTGKNMFDCKQHIKHGSSLEYHIQYTCISQHLHDETNKRHTNKKINKSNITCNTFHI